MARLTLPGALSAVLFGLLPFATSAHLFYGTVNIKYFFVVGVVTVLTLIVAGKIWSGASFIGIRHRPLLIAAGTTLAVYWLAAFLGVFPERSFFADIQRSSGVFFLTHVAVLAFILGEFLSERDWSLLRRSIAVSGGVFGVLSLMGVEGMGLSGHFLWGDLDMGGFTFGNSTFAGTYLMLALVAALIELVKTTPRTSWWYWLMSSAAGIALSPVLFNVGILWGRTPLTDILNNPILALGSARASSAAALLLIAFFGGYLLLRKYAGENKKYAASAWAGVFVVAITLGLTLLFTPGSFVQQKYIEASTGARLVVWEMGIEAFKERPLLGWGSENFGRAYQSHFDDRLYQREYIGEIWFDRAHNVVIDTLVDVGVVGALALLSLAGVFVRTVYRALARGIIGEPEAVLLFALPVAHFLQLQTGFDTIGSFTLLGMFGGYGLWLERQVEAQENKEARVHFVSRFAQQYRKGIAVVLVMLTLASGKVLFFDELVRQVSLFKLFYEKDAEKQLQLARTATSRTSSFESLRLPSASLIKGVLDTIAETGLVNRTAMAKALAQMEIYEERYREYLEVQPDAYRARMNLAYLLSVERALGSENQIEEAKGIIAPGRELSPNNLLNPVMESLLELYSGNPKVAVAKARETVALNPNAPFGHEVLKYMLAQEKKFPSITVLRLENI